MVAFLATESLPTRERTRACGSRSFLHEQREGTLYTVYHSSFPVCISFTRQFRILSFVYTQTDQTHDSPALRHYLLTCSLLLRYLTLAHPSLDCGLLSTISLFSWTSLLAEGKKKSGSML